MMRLKKKNYFINPQKRNPIFCTPLYSLHTHRHLSSWQSTLCSVVTAELQPATLRFPSQVPTDWATVVPKQKKHAVTKWSTRNVLSPMFDWPTLCFAGWCLMSCSKIWAWFKPLARPLHAATPQLHQCSGLIKMMEVAVFFHASLTFTCYADQIFPLNNMNVTI